MVMDLPTIHQLITVILPPTRFSVSRCIVGHICVLAGGGEDGVASWWGLAITRGSETAVGVRPQTWLPDFTLFSRFGSPSGTCYIASNICSFLPAGRRADHASRQDGSGVTCSPGLDAGPGLLPRPALLTIGRRGADKPVSVRIWKQPRQPAVPSGALGTHSFPPAAQETAGGLFQPLLLQVNVRLAPESDRSAALPRARYSITSSARDRNDSEIVRPSALAVVKLMMRSNLVGCSTGMSAGFAPRRILST